MIGGDPLATEARRDIYELIRRSPGVHLRGVERGLGLSFGQVLYHLENLERNGLVDVRKDGGFKRYFVKNQVGRQEKDLISMFRHDLPRRIAIMLLMKPGLAHHEMLDRLGVSPSTLSFHLQKMVEQDVLTRDRRGVERAYRVKDERTAAKVLVMHRESFRDATVDRFTDLWLATNYRTPDERLEAAAEDRALGARLRGASTPDEFLARVLDG